LLLLAILNTIGIRESAVFALFMAIAALVVNLIVIVLVLFRARHEELGALRDTLALVKSVDGKTFLVGFSGAWLAFSGLESISQLSPAMRSPIERTAKRGMRLVVWSMILTAPLLTLLAVSLLPAAAKVEHSHRFISEIAGMYGGVPAKVAVVVSGSALLLLASNTAIIGCYHVFLALAERGFMPSAIARRNRYFGTPQIAILVATLVPVLVITASGGSLQTLAGMYAFGLLGAFVLSSAGLDVMRWRDGKRGIVFWLGVFTTVLVLVAWLVTFHVEGVAAAYGTAIVAIGVVMAVGTRRKWFSDWFYRLGWVADRIPERISETEERIEGHAQLEILSLTQAESIAQLYP
ncbi:MAG: APC family permease, partial [Steroidobacteraceae bacterium]